MNYYTQNQKIEQITETTLVVGVDIGSRVHYARAFDWRGRELSKVLKFCNCRDGFDRFHKWIVELQEAEKKDKAVELEPNLPVMTSEPLYITVAGFLAKVGDVRRFDSPKQIQKLAGLALKENSSGRHKGADDRQQA